MDYKPFASIVMVKLHETRDYLIVVLFVVPSCFCSTVKQSLSMDLGPEDVQTYISRDGGCTWNKVRFPHDAYASLSYKRMLVFIFRYIFPLPIEQYSSLNSRMARELSPLTSLLFITSDLSLISSATFFHLNA
jgi:hypothetical protein